jgi:hypothetical protein
MKPGAEIIIADIRAQSGTAFSFRGVIMCPGSILLPLIMLFV